MSSTASCLDSVYVEPRLCPPRVAAFLWVEKRGGGGRCSQTLCFPRCRNLRTGQLLRKMHVGYSYPASICHRAYSDSVGTSDTANTWAVLTNRAGASRTGVPRGVKYQLCSVTPKISQRLMG